MMEKMEEWPPTPFAEQDFLNRYFAAVYRPLPSCYNLVLAMLWRHPENVDVKKVKNVHYCAKVRERVGEHWSTRFKGG
jgi:inositol 3-alpha-galactosyltransferase